MYSLIILIRLINIAHTVIDYISPIFNFLVRLSFPNPYSKVFGIGGSPITLPFALTVGAPFSFFLATVPSTYIQYVFPRVYEK